MPRELAAQLVDSGAAAPEAVERAAARQRELGGALDTALLELDAVSGEALERALLDATGLPPAPPPPLPSDPRARRVFPARVAERHGLAPFQLDGRELHVLARAPVDLAALDEISFMLSLHLVPHAAPEWRVRELQAQVYGLELPERFAALARRHKAPPPAADSPAGPAAEAIPESDAAPRPAPQPERAPAPEPPAPPEPAPEPEPEAQAQARRPPDPEPEPVRQPEPVPKPAAAPSAPPSVKRFRAPEPLELALSSAIEAADPGAQLEPAPGPGGRPHWSREEAFAALDGARTRDEVVEVTLRYARDFFEAVAIFAVARDRVTGHDAAGWERAPERCRKVRMRLDEAALFRTALEAGGPSLGPLVHDQGTRAVLDALGRTWPRTALVYPVALHERVVCLLYADNGEAPVSPRRLGDLLLLCAAVGGALERILREAKRQRPRGPAAGAAPPSGAPPAAEPGAAAELVLEAPAPEPAAPVAPGPEAAPPPEIAAPAAAPAAELAPPAPALPAPGPPEPAAQAAEPVTPPEPELPLDPLEEAITIDEGPIIYEPPLAGEPLAQAAPAPVHAAEPPLAGEALARPGAGRHEPTAVNFDEPPPAAHAPRREPTMSFFDREEPGQGEQAPFGPVVLLRDEVRSEPEPWAGETDSWEIRDTRPLDVTPPAVPLAEPAPEVEPYEVAPAVEVLRGEEGSGLLVRRLCATRRGSPERAEALELVLRQGPDAAHVLRRAFPGPIEGGSQLPAHERGPVLAALAALGPVATPYLVGLLLDRDGERRRLAVQLLGHMRDPAAFLPLAERVLDGEVRVADAALQALAGLRDHPDFQPIVERLRRAVVLDADRSAQAATALGRLGDEGAIPLLIEVLESPGPVAAAAVRALERLTCQRLGASPAGWLAWWRDHGRERREDWAFAGLTSEDRGVRATAAELLAAAGVPPVVYGLDAPLPERQEAAERWRAWWNEQHLAL